jgi:hypothetical protein
MHLSNFVYSLGICPPVKAEDSNRCIARTADCGRRITVAQWSDASRRA